MPQVKGFRRLGVLAALLILAGVLLGAWGAISPSWRVERLVGLPGGIVQQILIHPTNAEALLVMAAEAPYLTMDRGKTWQRLDLPVGVHPRDLLLQFDPLSAKTLYAVGPLGVLVSRDGGLKWQSLQAPPGVFTAFAVSPVDGIFYLASHEHIWRSMDQGETWQDFPLPLYNARVLCLAPHPQVGGLLYAGTTQGLYVSGDRGETWYSITGEMPVEAVQRIAFDQTRVERLYVGTEYGAYFSEDGGAHWEPFVFTPSLPDFRPQERPLTGAWDPSRPTQVYLGTSHTLYASSDGGYTWEDIGQGLTAGAIRDLALGVPSGRLYALGLGGLYVVKGQGAPWELVNDLAGVTPNNAGVALIAQSTPTETLFLADQSELLASVDGGLTWEPLSGQPPIQGAIQDLVVVKRENGTSLCVVSSHVACQDVMGWHVLSLEGIPLAIAAPQDPLDPLYIGTERGLYRVPLGENAWSPQAMGHTLDGKPLALLLASGELFVATDKGSLYACKETGCERRLALQDAITVERATLVPPQKGRGPDMLALLPDGEIAALDSRGHWHRLFTPLNPHGGRFIVFEDSSQVYWVEEMGGIWRLAPRPNPYIPAALGVGALGLLGALVSGVAPWVAKRKTALRRGPEKQAERWDDVITETLLRYHRVTPEMLDTIPPHARLHAMARYVDGYRHQALIFQEDPPVIRPAREAGLRALTKDWAALLGALEDSTAAEAIAARMTERICTLLGFNLVASRAYHALAGYMVEAPTLRLSLPAHFPIIFLLKKRFEKEDIRHIRTLMSALNAVSFFALLVRVHDPDEARPVDDAMRRWLKEGAEDLVLLEYRDLCHLYLATDPEFALTQQILAQVDLTVVSPYVLSGPVPPKMFFGRDYEIKVILRTIQDRSFAIVGGRKIGKTSILNKVHRLLQQMTGFVPLYLDCHHISTYEGFFETLAVMCDVSVEEPSPEMLRRIVVRLRARHGEVGGTLVFLLDEVDHLLRYDLEQGTLLFRVFRSLSQEGLCRFIFCGERVLDTALQDPNSPLYNFCSVLRLGYLQERDAERIVQEPMKDMGISFEEPERIPYAIVALSGCHPNIVQVICQLLIERLNQRGDRVIREEDLAQLERSVEFRDLFFEISWGNTTTLERLITVLMIDQQPITPAHVRDALAAVGVQVSDAELEQALNGLLLASLFKRQGAFFEYTSAIFPRLLRETGLASSFRDGLIAKWHEEQRHR